MSLTKLVNKFTEYFAQKEFEHYIRENIWEGFKPGDILRYSGSEVPEQIIGYHSNIDVMYCGLARLPRATDGKVPEPIFCTTDPKYKNCMFSLRSAKASDFYKIGHADEPFWKELLEGVEKQVTEEEEQNYSEDDIKKLLSELSDKEVDKMNEVVMDRANTRWWCEQKMEQYKDNRFNYSSPNLERIAIEVYKELYLKH